MELKIKSLQGSTFTVSAEPSDTIGAIKSKIETAQGHAASSQKIIYSGKILTDAETVQSCGATEKDFLVLMVSKPKAAKPAAGAAAQTQGASTAAPSLATSSTSAADASAPAPAAAATAAAATTTPPAAAAAPAPSGGSAASPAAAITEQTTSSGPAGSSQFLTGTALEQAVNNICEMGFEKSEVQKAMRASFNNPERAVEYLMTGIPEHLNQPQQQQQAQSQAPARAAAAAGGGGGGGAASAQGQEAPSAAPQGGNAPSNPRSGNLFEAAAAQAQGGGGAGAGGRGAGGEGMDALRNLGEDDGSGNTALDLGNPAMLAQLRQLVQQNPAALAPLVQAVAQTQPQLANAMAENPEAMLELLASSAAQRSLGGEGDDEEGVPLPSMADLSQEDRTAVEQIVAMGIDENRAIEVYLMCGRNVEMAVQYYFENPQDFED